MLFQTRMTFCLFLTQSDHMVSEDLRILRKRQLDHFKYTVPFRAWKQWSSLKFIILKLWEILSEFSLPDNHMTSVYTLDNFAQ